MPIVSHYLCDVCKKVILDSLDGFVVHGNIYVADPVTKGGLIGNNFPKDNSSSVIKENVFCKNCFCEVLKIKQAPLTR